MAVWILFPTLSSQSVSSKVISDGGKKEYLRGFRGNLFRMFIMDYASVRFSMGIQKVFADSANKSTASLRNQVSMRILVSGLLNSLLFNAILIPIDIIRMNMMCELPNVKKEKFGKIYQSGKLVFNERSWKALWTGGSYTMYYSVIHMFLMTVTSFYLDLDEVFSYTKFFAANLAVSSVLYPLDTLT